MNTNLNTSTTTQNVFKITLQISLITSTRLKNLDQEKIHRKRVKLSQFLDESFTQATRSIEEPGQ